MTATDFVSNSKACGVKLKTLLGTCLLAAALSACGGAESATAEQTSMVLADTRTGMLFTAPVETIIPAVHPQTGQPTLSRAWYCPRCLTWHAVPPPEVMQRNAKAGKCRKTGAALQPTGPVPANATPLKSGT